MSSAGNRYLLISRVGPQSLHRAWLEPLADRAFDILLSSYDPAARDPGLPGVFFEIRPGTKVAGYAALFDAHADLIAQYDYVAVFDDDLMIVASDLTRLFETVSQHKLKIAQPALTHNSHFTFACLLRDVSFRLRYVNYIEMMCPVFRQDVFQAVRPLYALGYESGIDLIWCNLVATSPQDFAVIDDITVRHTRAVGTSKSANGFTGGKRYEDDIYAILAQFKLPWLSCVPYSGIRRDGSFERRRWMFMWSSFRLLSAIYKGPGRSLRARNIAVYWKHLMSRAALNLPVSLPETDTSPHVSLHRICNISETELSRKVP